MPILSTMYKKLHIAIKVAVLNPLRRKGFFFSCLPERDIMLTNFVYLIQLKNEKPTEQGSVGFSALGEEIRVGYWMPHDVMSSLLKLLFDIQIAC